MKSQKTGLVLSVTAILAVIVAAGYLAAAIKRFREPSYQGRPVSYWAEQLSRLNAQVTATEAIQAIGPKGVPFVFRRIREPHSAGWRFYRLARRRLPEYLQRATPWGPREIRVGEVGRALGLIGTSGLPELLRGLKDRDDDVRLAAILAIEPMAQQAQGLDKAVPALAASLHDPAADVRVEAAITLWRVNGDSNAVPLLIRELEHAGSGVTCRKIVHIFGEMGGTAKSAIPAMLQRAENPPPEPLVPIESIRDAAIDAIDRIDQRHRKSFVPPGQRKTFVEQIETPPVKTEYGEDTTAPGTEQTLHR
jgi:hypothetical protein